MPWIIIPLLIVRTLLLNINSAEWGDSYRILRASNFIQHFSYPQDEKRPPLFSAILALRPAEIDAVFWGHLVMLVIWIAAVFIFYKLSRKILKEKASQILATVFLVLSPVYLYWSLRIYADIPFSLIVLLCFYLLELIRKKPEKSAAKIVIMGALCGAGILTRFEGYLLTLSVFIGLLFINPANLKLKAKNVLLFFMPALLVLLPWLIYRNPLTSSYFEEPAGRKYDINMFLTYLLSYIGVLGVIPAAATLMTGVKTQTIRKYPHMFIFVVLESVLILVWPAAVPRLFVPVIPLLILAFVASLNRMFEAKKRLIVITTLLPVVAYVIMQNRLRLQFLGPQTLIFVAVSIVSLISALSIVLNRKRIFVISALVSMSLLSASTIYMHKDIYKSIKEAAVTAGNVCTDKTIHNDQAGIVAWYVAKSEYKNLDDKKYLSAGYITDNKISCVIITNEFNPGLEIDIKKRPYLTLVNDFHYIRGGKMFYTWLIKVQK